MLAAIQPVLQQFVDMLMSLMNTVGEIVAGQVMNAVLPVIVPMLTTLLQNVTTVFTGILTTVTDVIRLGAAGHPGRVGHHIGRPSRPSSAPSTAS